MPLMGLSGNGICLQYIVVTLKAQQDLLRITYHFPIAPLLCSEWLLVKNFDMVEYGEF